MDRYRRLWIFIVGAAALSCIQCHPKKRDFTHPPSVTRAKSWFLRPQASNIQLTQVDQQSDPNFPKSTSSGGVSSWWNQWKGLNRRSALLLPSNNTRDDSRRNSHTTSPPNASKVYKIAIARLNIKNNKTLQPYFLPAIERYILRDSIIEDRHLSTKTKSQVPRQNEKVSISVPGEVTASPQDDTSKFVPTVNYVTPGVEYVVPNVRYIHPTLEYAEPPPPISRYTSSQVRYVEPKVIYFPRNNANGIHNGIHGLRFDVRGTSANPIRDTQGNVFFNREVNTNENDAISVSSSSTEIEEHDITSTAGLVGKEFASENVQEPRSLTPDYVPDTSTFVSEENFQDESVEKVPTPNSWNYALDHTTETSKMKNIIPQPQYQREPKVTTTPRPIVVRHLPRLPTANSSGFIAKRVGDDYNSLDEDSIPGVPEEDYPTYKNIPDTAFRCGGIYQFGYYADVDTRCQVFHMCHGKFQDSFLCPIGTQFNQQYLVCDWWYNVQCTDAVKYYALQDVSQLKAPLGNDGSVELYSGYGESSSSSSAESSARTRNSPSVREVTNRRNHSRVPTLQNDRKLQVDQKSGHASVQEPVIKSPQQSGQVNKNTYDVLTAAQPRNRMYDNVEYYGGSKPYIPPLQVKDRDKNGPIPVVWAISSSHDSAKKTTQLLYEQTSQKIHSPGDNSSPVQYSQVSNISPAIIQNNAYERDSTDGKYSSASRDHVVNRNNAPRSQANSHQESIEKRDQYSPALESASKGNRQSHPAPIYGRRKVVPTPESSGQDGPFSNKGRYAYKNNTFLVLESVMKPRGKGVNNVNESASNVEKIPETSKVRPSAKYANYFPGPRRENQKSSNHRVMEHKSEVPNKAVQEKVSSGRVNLNRSTSHRSSEKQVSAYHRSSTSRPTLQYPTATSAPTWNDYVTPSYRTRAKLARTDPQYKQQDAETSYPDRQSGEYKNVENFTDYHIPKRPSNAIRAKNTTSNENNSTDKEIIPPLRQQVSALTRGLPAQYNPRASELESQKPNKRKNSKYLDINSETSVNGRNPSHQNIRTVSSTFPDDSRSTDKHSTHRSSPENQDYSPVNVKYGQRLRSREKYESRTVVRVAKSENNGQISGKENRTSYSRRPKHVRVVVKKMSSNEEPSMRRDAKQKESTSVDTTTVVRITTTTTTRKPKTRTKIRRIKQTRTTEKPVVRTTTTRTATDFISKDNPNRDIEPPEQGIEDSRKNDSNNGKDSSDDIASSLFDHYSTETYDSANGKLPKTYDFNGFLLPGNDVDKHGENDTLKFDSASNFTLGSEPISKSFSVSVRVESRVLPPSSAVNDELEKKEWLDHLNNSTYPSSFANYNVPTMSSVADGEEMLPLSDFLPSATTTFVFPEVFNVTGNVLTQAKDNSENLRASSNKTDDEIFSNASENISVSSVYAGHSVFYNPDSTRNSSDFN